MAVLVASFACVCWLLNRVSADIGNIAASDATFAASESEGSFSDDLKTAFQRTPKTSRPTPSSRPTAVSDHFLSDNHSPNDIELVPLELIHSSRDTLRKAREAYLIERGQTLEPKGINKREEI